MRRDRTYHVNVWVVGGLDARCATCDMDVRNGFSVWESRSSGCFCALLRGPHAVLHGPEVIETDERSSVFVSKKVIFTIYLAKY